MIDAQVMAAIEAGNTNYRHHIGPSSRFSKPVKNKSAERVISAFGGVPVVASIIGIHRTNVYKWMKPVSVHGTNGMVPMKYAVILLNAAKQRGISLSADDFVPTGEATK